MKDTWKDGMVNRAGEGPRVICSTCGQDNRFSRKTCWKCDALLHQRSQLKKVDSITNNAAIKADMVQKSAKTFPLGWVLSAVVFFIFIGFPLIYIAISELSAPRKYTVSSGNDLEELSKAWVSQRYKIMEYERAGDREKAAQVRHDFQQTNQWLTDFRNEDVAKAVQRAEREQGMGK